MDADEALARALQAEEVAAAQQQQQQQQGDANRRPAGPPGSEPQLAQEALITRELRSELEKALSVEDPAAQRLALAVLPLAQLRREAQQTHDLNQQLAPSEQQLGVDDLLVQGMLAWFGGSFFTWVNAPPCETCGSGSTTHEGMAAPTAEEAAGGAGRVEVYRCPACGSATRFPRYTNPARLLETRRGRCGEWAHCFLLFLRAAGLEARHVTISGDDHVFCEFYSSSGVGRWVHVDPCERAWDTPLVYEAGWGKKVAYVFAASRHGVADVTRRYVVQPKALLSRRMRVPEAWLSSALASLTQPLRARLDDTLRRRLAVRDATEALQLMSLEDGGAQGPATGSLGGRRSGSQAWRQSRGESGSSAAASSGPCGPYRLAPDSALPELFCAAGRIAGGACRASGENTGGTPSEIAPRAFDGSLSSSKWLDFGGGGPQGSAWLEYRLLPAAAPAVVSHYDLGTAGDCPERDPCDWVLECVPEPPGRPGAAEAAGGRWLELDRQTGQRFGGRHQLRSFVVPPPARVASRRWRLRITRTADPSAANSVQLACLNLWQAEAAQRALGCHGAACHEAAVQVLYADAAARSRVASMLQGGAAVVEPTGASAEALGTLRRIATNLRHHPGNPKFWQLAAGSAKLQEVLQHELLRTVLFELGFRPVLMPEPGGANNNARGQQQQQQHVKLVADATIGGTRDFMALLQQLLGPECSA